MTAYYLEINVHAAQWLRNLMAEGVIAPGVVDERDIWDVSPADLVGFTQCHIFAGIGVWSYAARRAGWPDSRPLWTGSCPCQPFSAAGAGGGFADERHAWPALEWLVGQLKPDCFFGEQVASKLGLEWFDVVHADLENQGYAVGVSDICAAGVGAPQIRQRLFFVASTEGERLQRRQDDGDEGRRQRASGQGCEAGKLEHAARDGWEQRRSEPSEWGVVGGRGASELGHALGAGRKRHGGDGADGRQPGRLDTQSNRSVAAPIADMRPGSTNGFWRGADWIGCTDGKWRPIEPESFPLVNGSTFRLGSGGAFENKSRAKMLKGYGNAIVAPLAAEFIRAYMESVT